MVDLGSFRVICEKPSGMFWIVLKEVLGSFSDVPVKPYVIYAKSSENFRLAVRELLDSL